METEAIRTIPNVRQKFVLSRVVVAGEEALLLWGNPDIQWHKDIVEEMTKAGYEITKILGGGWLLPKPEDGVTYVWGTSDRLGEAPIRLVREALKGEVIQEEPK